MDKEKFLYEIIDKYAYLACLGCMIKENYYLSDGTDDYVDVVEVINRAMEFYDQLKVGLDGGTYNEDVRESLLNALVMELVNITSRNILRILEQITSDALSDIKDDFMQSMLMLDDKSKRKEINRELLVKYLNSLREIEESSNMLGGRDL